MNDFQVLGSAITYIRRYAISSMLGLVTDKDTDAGGEQVKDEPKKQTLDAKRFQDAVKAVTEGKITRESLETKFTLTDGQTDILNAL
jgi:uncharacterized protein YdeI (BOF family)